MDTPTQPTAIPVLPPRRISRRLAILVVLVAFGVLVAWALGTPPGVLGKADAIAYAICHRIESRTFNIDADTLMPLCARCTGIYLGVMISYLVTVAARRTRVGNLPPRSVIAVLLLFVGIMGFDGVNSYLHLFPGVTGLYEPNNVLRLVTGMGCGLALFNLVFPVFNSMAWQAPDQGRPIENLRELLGLCAVAVIVILIVLSDRPVFMWVFGVVSTLGVILMLTMIGTVLFLSFTRLHQSVQHWRDLAIPLLAGLTLAFIEIGAIDILRFALTQTWAGFKL